MTATTRPETKSTSRRAMLVGALGGLAAMAASAIGRPTKSAATDGQALIVGQSNTASNNTQLSNTADADTTLTVTAGGIAIYAASGTDIGVVGASEGSVGVRGWSAIGTGPGVQGWASSNATGVQGHSGSGASLGTPPQKTGVYGYAEQDSTSKGVYGRSPAGWAGYFVGRVYTSKYHEMKEVATPPAPGANKARLFVRDNGSGKSQLCVRFNTGGVLVIKTQP